MNTLIDNPDSSPGQCRWCKGEFNKTNKQFTHIVDDYGYQYCNTLCRKSHEKDLIEGGNIDGIQRGTGFAVLKDTNFKDVHGEKIWFPKDGKPYFDKALRKTFNSIEEKQKHMKEKGIFMEGSTSPKKWPIESGDMRNKSYRKEHRLED